MKSLCLTGCFLLFIACKHSVAPEHQSFTVMSYNIRFDTDRDTGSHDWRERRERVAAVSREADIIGMQELTPGQLEDLKDLLPEYHSFGPEILCVNAIFYLPGKFQLIRADTIRLPRLDGSGINRKIYRAYFIEREDYYPFLMYNTHLDHVGSQARHRAAEILRDSIAAHTERYQIASIVITGDFNSTVDAHPYAELIKHGYKDAALEIGYEGNLNTFTGWGTIHLWTE